MALLKVSEVVDFYLRYHVFRSFSIHNVCPAGPKVFGALDVHKVDVAIPSVVTWKKVLEIVGLKNCRPKKGSP